MKNLITASLMILMWESIAACSILEMGDSQQKIVGGYCFVAGSSVVLTGICRCGPGPSHEFVIAPDIVDADWNREFIVVKRHMDEFRGTDTRWYVIDVIHQKLYGPFLYGCITTSGLFSWMMIAVWSGKSQSSAGRIRSVQNILAPTFDMIATNQGPINKY